MKEFSNAEDLCRDAFAGELSADLREQIVLGMARTRRVARFANAAKVVVVVALFLFGVVFLNRPARRSFSVAVTQAGQAKASQSLSFLRINSVAFSGVVRSMPLAEQMVIRSVPTTVAIVHSNGPRGYEKISDEQMFRLLQGWSIALVRLNGVSELELLSR